VKIADVFFRGLLDDSLLQVDAVKAGDKAGQAMGTRMSKTLGSALSVGLKAGFGVLAGGAAIALKGITALDDITAKFAADTGATAEEAKAAGKAINAMGGRNLQSLSEIGDALTVVHTDMGLTGKAAEDTTEKFLKYATATNQQAAPAVKDFDDILDAWNLTAADAQNVMDELIASHQKYGGSITANQQALAKMAPQLQALNADWRDGIGLLNLFAASGLDSEKALTALNTAVTKLKPGQTLNDLVREISAIPDPTKRAQKAVEIFGAKGGVALANALRPGVTSLKDFEITAADAAGATQKAADQIEGSFSNRIKLAIKAVGSEIIGLGQDFGPVLTGLAGLASLAGSLGLGDKIAGALKAAGKSSAVQGAAAAAGHAVGVAMAAAFEIGEKIIEAASEGLSKIAERSGIKVLAAKAGSVIGTVFATAMGLAEKLAEAATAAFVKLPVAPAVRAAVLAAGIELGTLQGTTVGKAILAVFAAAPLVIPILVIPTIQGLLPKVGSADEKAAVDWFDSKLKNAQSGMDDAAATAGTQAGQSFASGVGDGLSEGIDKPLKAADGAFHTIGTAASTAAGTVDSATARMRRAISDFTSALKHDEATVNDYYTTLITQDNLAATNAQIAAQKRIIASKTATNAEKHDAAVTLHSLERDQSQYILDLAAAGKTGSKALTTALASLHKRLASARGAERAAILAEIHAYDRLIAKANIAAAAVRFPGNQFIGNSGRAKGGPVFAGQTYTVGEKGPETFVPMVSGLILPHAMLPTMPSVEPAPSSSSVNFGAVNINLYGAAKPGDGQRLGREFMLEVANGFRQEGARNGLHPRKP
jgi:hypothetical protein